MSLELTFLERRRICSQLNYDYASGKKIFYRQPRRYLMNHKIDQKRSDSHNTNYMPSLNNILLGKTRAYHYLDQGNSTFYNFLISPWLDTFSLDKYVFS